MTDRNEEITCAQCFLRWYGTQNGTEYNNPIKAEKVFPELKGKVNWDFVATPKSNNEGQKLALEVKRVIRPHFRIQRSQWSGLLSQVNRNLPKVVNGKFVITTPVNLHPPKGTRYHVLNLNKSSEGQLVVALADVIGKNAPHIKIHETKDLGTEILQQFPDWPRRMKNACEFELMKTADEGFCIEIAGFLGGMFHEEEALREAIRKLDMNTQLQLAREKGFARTFLLLDLNSMFDWSPDSVRRALLDINFESPDTSKIYLVQVSNKKVAEVWSAG